MNKIQLINKLEKEVLLQTEKAKKYRIQNEFGEALFADGKKAGLLISIEHLKQLNEDIRVPPFESDSGCQYCNSDEKTKVVRLCYRCENHLEK